MNKQKIKKFLQAWEEAIKQIILSGPKAVEKIVYFEKKGSDLVLKYKKSKKAYRKATLEYHIIIASAEFEPDKMLKVVTKPIQEVPLSFEWARLSLEVITYGYRKYLIEDRELLQQVGTIYGLFYAIYRSIVPLDFRFGKYAIPWRVSENRAFLSLLFRRALFIQDMLRESMLAKLAFEEILYLNSNDEIGVRELLSTLYLELGCDHDMRCLGYRYDMDRMLHILLGRILACFRLHEEGEAFKFLEQDYEYIALGIQELLKKQHKEPHGFEYERTPPMGSPKEAFKYWVDQGHVWQDTKGALLWLKKSVKKLK